MFLEFRLYGLTAEPPLDDFESDHRFSQGPLQNVKPSGPSVENAASADKRVEERQDRSGPSHQSDPVGAAQIFSRFFGEIIRLKLGISLLCREPMHQGLAIVVANATAQLLDFPSNSHPLRVTVLDVVRMSAPVECYNGRVQGAG